MALSVDEFIAGQEAKLKALSAQWDAEAEVLAKNHDKMFAQLEAERKLGDFKAAVEKQLEDDYHRDVKPKEGKGQPDFVAKVSLPGLGDLGPLGRYLEDLNVSNEDARLWDRLTDEAVHQIMKGDLEGAGQTHVLEERKVKYVEALIARDPKRIIAKWRLMAQPKGKSHLFKSKFEQFKVDVLHKMSHAAQGISGAKAREGVIWCEKKATFVKGLLNSMDREGQKYVEELGESSYHVYRLMVENLLAKTRLDQRMYEEILEVRTNFD